LSQLVPEIEQAERDGFAGAWAADLPFVAGLDVMTLLAGAAGHTTTIALGSYVAPVYAYPPTTLAHQALSIQVLSGGRFVLGIGLSHPPVVQGMLGIKGDRPVAYLQEYLAILLPLLRGEAIDHRGEWFEIHVEPAMGPVPCPPVLIAALGPQMLRLAGTLADGTGLTMCGPRYMEQVAIPTITKAATAACRGPMRIAAAVPVCVTNNPEAAKAAARAMVPYEDLPSYRRVLDADGLRNIGDICIVGDEPMVRAGLTRLADIGITDLVAMQLRFDEDPDAEKRTRQLLTELAAAKRLI
jgi:F420-dependent oxidoreductase-like protein